jgi:hypothetical protein
MGCKQSKDVSSAVLNTSNRDKYDQRTKPNKEHSAKLEEQSVQNTWKTVTDDINQKEYESKDVKDTNVNQQQSLFQTPPRRSSDKNVVYDENESSTPTTPSRSNLTNDQSPSSTAATEQSFDSTSSHNNSSVVSSSLSKTSVSPKFKDFLDSIVNEHENSHAYENDIVPSLESRSHNIILEEEDEDEEDNHGNNNKVIITFDPDDTDEDMDNNNDDNHDDDDDDDDNSDSIEHAYSSVNKYTLSNSDDITVKSSNKQQPIDDAIDSVDKADLLDSIVKEHESSGAYENNVVPIIDTHGHNIMFEEEEEDDDEDDNNNIHCDDKALFTFDPNCDVEEVDDNADVVEEDQIENKEEEDEEYEEDAPASPDLIIDELSQLLDEELEVVEEEDSIANDNDEYCENSFKRGLDKKYFDDDCFSVDGDFDEDNQFSLLDEGSVNNNNNVPNNESDPPREAASFDDTSSRSLDGLHLAQDEIKKEIQTSSSSITRLQLFNMQEEIFKSLNSIEADLETMNSSSKKDVSKEEHIYLTGTSGASYTSNDEESRNLSIDENTQSSSRHDNLYSLSRSKQIDGKIRRNDVLKKQNRASSKSITRTKTAVVSGIPRDLQENVTRRPRQYTSGLAVSSKARKNMPCHDRLYSLASQRQLEGKAIRASVSARSVTSANDRLHYLGGVDSMVKSGQEKDLLSVASRSKRSGNGSISSLGTSSTMTSEAACSRLYLRALEKKQRQDERIAEAKKNPKWL